MEEIKIDDIDQQFTSCGHSVNLIYTIVNDTDAVMTEHMTQQDKNDIVFKNVDHLNIISNKDWYINDTETRQAPANKESFINAINTGKDYLTANGFDYDSQN